MRNLGVVYQQPVSVLLAEHGVTVALDEMGTTYTVRHVALTEPLLLTRAEVIGTLRRPDEVILARVNAAIQAARVVETEEHIVRGEN